MSHLPNGTRSVDVSPSSAGWSRSAALPSPSPRAWRGFRGKARGPLLAAGVYACAAVILLALVGILAPLMAGILAFLALGSAAGLAVIDGRKGETGWRDTARGALGHTGAGFGYLGADTRGIWRRIMARIRRRGQVEETTAVVAEHVTTRNIPPVRMDPALGPMPEPAMIASVQAPAPYLELAKFIAQFEPEDDQALTMFMQSLRLRRHGRR